MWILDRWYQLLAVKSSRKDCTTNVAELRERLVLLSNLQCVLALTTDGWTSCAGDSYLSFTAYFIDDSYK